MSLFVTISILITWHSFSIQVKGIYEEGNPALKQEKADRVFYMETDLIGIDNPSFYHQELYSIADDPLYESDHTPVFNNFSLKACTIHHL